ncbi:hypothetical protein pipiens_000781, partial [Culex pipiens pipiens]
MYVAAVVEYLAIGVLEMTAQEARGIPRHVLVAMESQDELNRLERIYQLFMEMCMSETVPGCHFVLLPEK